MFRTFDLGLRLYTARTERLKFRLAAAGAVYSTLLPWANYMYYSG